MLKTRNLVYTSLCIALGVVLPLTLHSIPNAGSMFLPMHLPVLLCGLLCGWSYGLLCGAVTPIISSVLTSMPPMAFVPAMACELAVYGLLSGLLLKIIKTKKPVVNIYISLIISMIAGRVIFGLINAVIFNAGSYSVQIWVTSVFVTGLPGIIIQLILIPVIILALRKAHLAHSSI